MRQRSWEPERSNSGRVISELSILSARKDVNEIVWGTFILFCLLAALWVVVLPMVDSSVLFEGGELGLRCDLGRGGYRKISDRYHTGADVYRVSSRSWFPGIQ